MTSESAFRYWLITVALCIVAMAVSMAYVDRPVAEFVEAHIRHTQFWDWLDRALSPFVFVVGAALLCFLGCGVWLISGHELPTWTETPFLISAAVMWGIACEIGLKHIFGRGWPDPTFVQQHRYGFRLLHGDRYWDSFPSGHATVALAILSVLWILKSRWAVPVTPIAALLLAALVLGNSHWLSDVIAGAFLGASIGWMTVRLLHSVSKGILN
jgi:membrane-associated phospholipid phosphatase